jgi:hypothetical protein
LVSAGGAGSSAGTRNGTLQFWFGNAAGLGGFLYIVRFGISLAPATYRWFVGMSATAGAFGNANPSTLQNLFGFGSDSGDSLIYFMNNAASTTTKTSTGLSKPVANVDFYEVRMFCAPNTTTVYYSIENTSTSTIVEGSVNSNLPAITTLLGTQIWVNNGTTGTAAAIDVQTQYIETLN